MYLCLLKSWGRYYDDSNWNLIYVGSATSTSEVLLNDNYFAYLSDDSDSDFRSSETNISGDVVVVVVVVAVFCPPLPPRNFTLWSLCSSFSWSPCLTLLNRHIYELHGWDSGHYPAMLASHRSVNVCENIAHRCRGQWTQDVDPPTLVSAVFVFIFRGLLILTNICVLGVKAYAYRFHRSQQQQEPNTHGYVIETCYSTDASQRAYTLCALDISRNITGSCDTDPTHCWTMQSPT